MYACRRSCTHYKDPVILVRVRWVAETPKYPACMNLDVVKNSWPCARGCIALVSLMSETATRDGQNIGFDIWLKYKCSDVLNKSVFTRISTVNAFCLCVISFLLKTHIMLWNLDSHPTQVQLKTRTVLKLAVTEMVSLPLTYSTFSLSPHYQSAPLSSNYTAHSSLN